MLNIFKSKEKITEELFERVVILKAKTDNMKRLRDEYEEKAHDSEMEYIYAKIKLDTVLGI